MISNPRRDDEGVVKALHRARNNAGVLIMPPQPFGTERVAAHHSVSRRRSTQWVHLPPRSLRCLQRVSVAVLLDTSTEPKIFRDAFFYLKSYE